MTMTWDEAKEVVDGSTIYDPAKHRAKHEDPLEASEYEVVIEEDCEGIQTVSYIVSARSREEAENKVLQGEYEASKVLNTEWTDSWGPGVVMEVSEIEKE